MFEQVLREIESHDTIIIHRHKSPDGDALGSQIGLALLLKDNYPDKAVYTVGDGAGRFDFMDCAVMDHVADAAFPAALSIILDTSAASLISDSRYLTAARTVRIDHHIFCESIADVEVTDTSYESCCGLITEMALECGWKLSPPAAKSLYTGMVTDSGRFRYDSTSANTHRLASALLAAGVDTASIYGNLYADDFSFLRLRAQFVLKIRFYGGSDCPDNDSDNNNSYSEKSSRVAYIYTDRAEAAAYCAENGVDTFTISRGMVNTMSDIRGVDIWVNFTETETGVLAELRSSKYNINPIAVKYGGGGHAKASGATLKNREEAMRMLSDLRELTNSKEIPS